MGRSRALTLITIFCLMASSHLPAAETERLRFVAKVDQVFSGPPEAPMRMPTAVAVDDSRHVFVADGVNDRVVEFGNDGEFVREIREIGPNRLSRPMSVKLDTLGRLWIADTGNGRVLVRRLDGGLERAISPPPDAALHPVDITDVAPLADRQHAWLVDNENHRVLQVNLETLQCAPIGERGDAAGRFHHPFMLAAGPQQTVFVSDAINGRVVALTDPNVLPRTIGQYGIELGQLHRPKGVAVDADGRVWVADGSLGTIQVFRQDGRYEGVVRTEDGGVLHLQSPAGLAVRENELYVTELILNRIQRFVIETQAAPQASPSRTPDNSPAQPRTCTACHLEWIPPFNQNRATPLADPPRSRPDEPYVSTAQSCLSCHDGSVVDSRREVWDQHGHRTGLAPPADMRVPSDLPLVDGLVQCRTCHSAHTRGGSGQGMKDAVFLRVEHQADELCVRCHSAYSNEPSDRNHPARNLPQPLPADLVAAGGHAADFSSLTGCMVCHTAHGSGDDHLLVPMPTSESLCLSCHEQLDPSAFGRESVLHHPLSRLIGAIRTPPQASIGSEKSTNSDTVCITCHRMHGAHDRPLLVDTITDSNLCLKCHREYKGVLGSVHDFRIRRPQIVNERGLLAEQSGPCGACHAVHHLARRPEPAHADPSGECTTCHSGSADTHATFSGRVLHPLAGRENDRSEIPDRLPPYEIDGEAASGAQIGCSTCHNPHVGSERNASLLRLTGDAQPQDLCFNCHSETATITHSFHSREGLQHVPMADTACGPCHAVHAPRSSTAADVDSEPPPLMWQWPYGPPVVHAETAYCTSCHSQAAGLHEIAYRKHPPVAMVNVYPPDHPGYMPLVDLQGRGQLAGTVSCITCHLPHGRASGAGFDALRTFDQPEPVIHATKPMLRPYAAPNLCSSCHGFNGLSLFLTFHKTARDER